MTSGLPARIGPACVAPGEQHTLVFWLGGPRNPLQPSDFFF